MNKRWVAGRKEGNVLFNDAINTFLIWLYGVGHIWLWTIHIAGEETTAITTWATLTCKNQFLSQRWWRYCFSPPLAQWFVFYSKINIVYACGLNRLRLGFNARPPRLFVFFRERRIILKPVLKWILENQGKILWNVKWGREYLSQEILKNSLIY